MTTSTFTSTLHRPIPRNDRDWIRRTVRKANRVGTPPDAAGFLPDAIQQDGGRKRPESQAFREAGNRPCAAIPVPTNHSGVVAPTVHSR